MASFDSKLEKIDIRWSKKMVLEWQEIDKLRQDVKTLQRQLSRQEIKLSNKPILRVGNIVATDITNPRYALQEIGVDSEKEEAHVKAGLIGSDPGPAQSKNPHSFLVDSGGNKFLLPDSNRVILVYDNGDGTGKQAEVDIDGDVTFPPGVESKNLVVAEPASQFHGGNYPWKTGRLIPGIQLVSTSGVSFFLVFCQGFGEATETSSIEVISTRIDVNHDTAGHIISVDSEILEVLSGTEMYRWGRFPDNWRLVTVSGNSPPARYNHTYWTVQASPQRRLYIHGGIGAGGVRLADTWKWTITGTYTGYWTQLSDAPVARANLASHVMTNLSSAGEVYVFGDTAGLLYEYNCHTDIWTQKQTGPFGATGPFNATGTNKYIYFIDAWNDLTSNSPKRKWQYSDNTWYSQAFGGPTNPRVSHYAFPLNIIFGGLGPTDTVFQIGVGYGPPMPAARYSLAGANLIAGLLFFGGRDSSGGATNTTWEFFLGAWAVKNPALVPSARYGHTLSLDGFLWGGRAA